MSLHPPPTELREPDGASAKPSRVGQVLGWVVFPLLVAAALVATGAHLGATQPEAWYTRAVRFIAGP